MSIPAVVEMPLTIKCDSNLLRSWDKAKKTESLRFFEVARVLVRFDQLASCIVNANYSDVRATEEIRVVNGVSYSLFATQQHAPKWKRIRE
jgi:hypothetical protein